MLWRSKSSHPHQRQRHNPEPLHQTHLSMSKIKGLARSYVWWPGMDENIERDFQASEECQKHQKSPPTATLHPWEWPVSPWSRIERNNTGLSRIMCIMQGLSWEQCFCLLLMLIWSGWTFTLWNQLHHRLPSKNWGRVSVCLACLKC